MPTLKKITYILPDNENAQAFLHHFLRLVGVEESNNANIDKESPADYLSATYFSLSSDVSSINVVFTPSEITPITAGNIHLGSAVQTDDSKPQDLDYALSTQHDEIGEYIKGKMNGQSFYWLSMEELAKRLQKAHVVIDHTGVNIPTSLVEESSWNQLVSQLGKEAVLFDYPHEPWPFIVPATEKELHGEITDLLTKRGPKFELVYDRYTPVPVIQLSLDTSLTKGEVHTLFPGPYAETFPNLAHLFRSVYIHSPWKGVALRVDVNYGSDAKEDGLLKYLLTEGKRV